MEYGRRESIQEFNRFPEEDITNFLIYHGQSPPTGVRAKYRTALQIIDCELANGHSVEVPQSMKGWLELHKSLPPPSGRMLCRNTTVNDPWENISREDIDTFLITHGRTPIGTQEDRWRVINLIITLERRRQPYMAPQSIADFAQFRLRGFLLQTPT